MEQQRKAWNVAIVELTVMGIKSYRARCTHCEWQGRPRDRSARAVADAKTHGAEHAANEEREAA